MSSVAEMMWPLNECDSQQCVLDNLDNKMEYIQGSTNTSGALYVTWDVSKITSTFPIIPLVLLFFLSWHNLIVKLNALWESLS